MQGLAISTDGDGGGGVPGPFSFDEMFGLVVDSLQIYGNEVIKLRGQNLKTRQMLKTLEANLVGELEEDGASRPQTPAAHHRTAQIETFVSRAAAVSYRLTDHVSIPFHHRR